MQSDRGDDLVSAQNSGRKANTRAWTKTGGYAPTARRTMETDLPKSMTQLQALRVRWDALTSERDDMRAWGDQMQSEASRLAEWASELWDNEPEKMPYEVGMAVVSVRNLVEGWTRLRCGPEPEIPEAPR